MTKLQDIFITVIITCDLLLGKFHCTSIRSKQDRRRTECHLETHESHSAPESA